MKIGAFKFFERMHSNGTPINSFVIASLHWPSSITWRWSIAKHEYYKYGAKGFSFMRTHKGRGINFTLSFNSRLTGMISMQTQPNMWRNE